MYRFEFPERPGALRRFLSEIPSGFDISLFHYRNHGADVGRVLVGLVAVDGDWAALEGFVKHLGYKYVREDDNIGKSFVPSLCPVSASARPTDLIILCFSYFILVTDNLIHFVLPVQHTSFS